MMPEGSLESLYELLTNTRLAQKTFSPSETRAKFVPLSLIDKLIKRVMSLTPYINVIKLFIPLSLTFPKSKTVCSQLIF